MKKLLIILLFPISIFSQYIPGESSIIVDPIKYMHKLLNEYRVENGLDTVALDTSLTKQFILIPALSQTTRLKIVYNMLHI